eukprot:TRINITY_DN13528_c0_g2_i2.p1 TRINITY_DN13528_c0_g2~~TRINITY_DN13528_c0_g2_i2.p1  ORF type:complete len:344 (+),score=43.48 TRINITY_DN13528_c0_g2_i2:1718-2749(+)
MYVAKIKPYLFCQDTLWPAVTSFLVPPIPSATRFKKSCITENLACGLLYAGWKDKKNWPIEFIQVYCDDASGERTWVDDEYCSPFVNAVTTVFGNSLDGDRRNFVPNIGSKFSDENHYKFREYLPKLVESLINDARNKSLTNVIKFLLIAVDFPEVRVLCSTHLENWFNNPMFCRCAKELITQIMLKTQSLHPTDLETVKQIIFMNVKGMNMSFYIENLKGFLEGNPLYSITALHHYVYSSEIILANPKVFTIVYQSIPDNREFQLAMIIQEMIYTKHPDLKTILRSIFKTLGYQIDFFQFCVGMLSNFNRVKEDRDIGEREVSNVLQVGLYLLAISKYQPTI